MSQARPFTRRPEGLDGISIGTGYDPFHFAPNPAELQWQRTAEVKHARIAMIRRCGMGRCRVTPGPAISGPMELIFRFRYPSGCCDEYGGLAVVGPQHAVCVLGRATLGVASAID